MDLDLDIWIHPGILGSWVIADTPDLQIQQLSGTWIRHLTHACVRHMRYEYAFVAIPYRYNHGCFFVAVGIASSFNQKYEEV